MTSAAQMPADRQLPRAGEIFLDHVGHFVRDQQAAARALTRAGFAPAPLSVQVNPDPRGGPPQLTGTGNVTAMFTRGYLEVLFKTAETPLGRQLDAALARYPGIHLAAFAVADASAEHARLAAAGFRTQPVVSMQRPVETASAPGIARFTLARVEPGEMPEGRIQMLVHHTEDMVWQPRWLDHPNGAIGLTALTIAVADVEEAATRFVRFTGRAAEQAAYGQAIRLDRGRLEFVTADRFESLLPQCPIPSLPFAGLCSISVRSLARLKVLLHQADLTAYRIDGTLIVPFPEELGRGAWRFHE